MTMLGVNTMKTRLLALGTALIVCSAAVSRGADDTQALKKENAELRQRVGTLETELKDIKTLLGQQAKQLEKLQQSSSSPSSGAAAGAGAAQTQPADPAKSELAEVREQVRRDAERQATKRLSLWSSLDVNLYGYIKLDTAWDLARTDAGDFARWVESEQGRVDDGQFNVTAKQTRLGLKFKGPESDGLKTSGRIEIDFYGGGTENKPVPMLRHAYMVLDWPTERFSILAGQTSDVFSPLNPETLNYSVQWWAGNIGYRRPQVRLTKVFKLADDVDLKLEGAVARTIGRDGPFDPGDTGEDRCLPGIQGRTSLTFPLFAPKPTTVGFSGHFAIEEYDLDAADTHRELESWSANLDVTQPITTWMEIKGELFTGQLLDPYLGGIGQGVSATTVRGLASCGGWLAVCLTPWKQWTFNVGASVEALDKGEVAADARTVNRTIWGNVLYSITDHASVGFELSNWHTDYKGRSPGDSMRAQMSFIYKF